MDERRMCIAVIFLLLIVVGFTPLRAQNENIDSLRIAYSVERDDSLKWEIGTDIAQIFLRKNLDSMLEWTLMGHRLALASNNERLKSLSYQRLGIVYFKKGEFQLSLQAFNDGIQICRRINKEEQLHYMEFEMAQVYRDMGDYTNAKKYIDRFYNFYSKKKDGRRIVIALSSYSSLYEKLEIADSVLFYSKKALEAAIAYDEKDYINILYTNLAGAYYYNKKYEEALSTSREARKLAIEQQDIATLFYSEFAIGLIFEDLNQTDSSLHYFLLALQSIKQYGDLKEEAQTTEKIASQYEKLGDYKEAYKFHKISKELGDSLLNKIHDKQAAELNIQYETQQKETEIARQALQLEKEQSRIYIFLFVGITLLLITIIIFIGLRNRQQITTQALRAQKLEAVKLKELDRLKNNFFTSISHEFRTPLSLILGPLKEMQQKEFSGDRKAYLEMVTRNGERLLKLVNQLLDLSQLELGQMKLHFEPANLTSFLKTLVLPFENLASSRKISFESFISSEDIYVHIDADKLEKIISNLLTNAIKFTPSGGTVSFIQNILPDRFVDKTTLEFVISDTGTGIAEEEVEYIFHRFYSITRNTNIIEGNGIGLALVKELVELLEGDIQVESALDKGSSFRIRLDLPKAEETAIKPLHFTSKLDALEQAETIHSSSLYLDTEKDLLLIVEDHPDMRKYICDQLNGDYRLLKASDGKQGLNLALEHIPDLIVSDLMLPEMDGNELCEAIRNNTATSHIPFIMLTAKSAYKDLLQGISVGADAYLTKPFESEELKLRIKKLIAQRKQLQQKFMSDSSEGSIHIQIGQLPSQDESFLKKLVEIIKENMANEAFSIPDMGREIGMSRSQLHRKLKALTDHSPSSFLRVIRLQQAYQLLQQNFGNISEVAQQVGIPNLSYFSRVFSKQYGYPPSEILQKKR